MLASSESSGATVLLVPGEGRHADGSPTSPRFWLVAFALPQAAQEEGALALQALWCAPTPGDAGITSQLALLSNGTVSTVVAALPKGVYGLPVGLDT